MDEKSIKMEMPEISVVRKEGAQMVPITGVFGTLSPDGGQVTFFHDTVIPTVLPKGGMMPGTIERTIVLETHMSPQTFVSIAHWMMRKAEELEQFMEDQKKDTIESMTEE